MDWPTAITKQYTKIRPKSKARLPLPLDYTSRLHHRPLLRTPRPPPTAVISRGGAVRLASNPLTSHHLRQNDGGPL